MALAPLAFVAAVDHASTPSLDCRNARMVGLAHAGQRAVVVTLSPARSWSASRTRDRGTWSRRP